MEQNIGRGNGEAGRESEHVLERVIDHTGRTHLFPSYDIRRAEEEAEEHEREKGIDQRRRKREDQSQQTINGYTLRDMGNLAKMLGKDPWRS